MTQYRYGLGSRLPKNQSFNHYILQLVVVENVTIRYSYGVPTEKRRKPSFYWDFLRWERCSAECGPGIEESLPSCVEKIGGEVDAKYCKKIPKPNVQIRACEIAPCVTRYGII